MAYVRGRNIHVEDLLDHSIHPVTSAPSDTIFNGRFDRVYEEELQVRDGFFPSPG